MVAIANTDVGRGDRTFIGHPRGLAWLCFTEVWERFSYYGMQVLLVLYLTHQLLHPGHIEHILGFGPFRAPSRRSMAPCRRRRSPRQSSVFTLDWSGSRRFSADFSPTALSDARAR